MRAVQHFRVIVLLLQGLLMGASVCRAGDTPPACGPYSLAFYELGVLFQREPDGHYSGIDKDVVDELARRSTCKFDTVIESRARIWSRLAKQTLDISVSGIATPERERFAEFMPYFQTRNFALMRRELAAELPSMEAFLADGRRLVAVVKSFKHGPSYDSFLAQLRAEKRVVEMADFEGVVKVWRAGRADLILVLPTSWAAMLRRDPTLEQGTLLDWAAQDRIPHGLIVSRSNVSDADKQRLRQAMLSMLADGSVDTILRRHLGEALARSVRLEPASGH
ncbi:transporter substrate-binding domain-containing protein [Paucibacter sp. APW11]|uniref:Transporter substrate-binding domain-containing protein n=1 Tax=Roseateles aquae TaxID=3077235 RepID=A0ABU3PH53_9BURK|nr:transporter substrate-binding domain-containing protein [Paucibacter sp. APW11]MDT9001707.1 transporter substrate-binding domain-containing protein [Paucibacter sp. APW11]